MYSSNIIEYELVSGEKDKVGRKCRGAVKVAGRRLELTDEMVELEEAAPGQDGLRGRHGPVLPRDQL